MGRHNNGFIASTVAGAAGILAGAAHAQQLAAQQVAGPVYNPVFVTAPPGDLSRLFIVEQRGYGGIATRAAIEILDLTTGALKPQPFLTIDPVSTGEEQGLLGLAFAPDYATSGLFFVNYTNSSGDNAIVRYHVSSNPDLADPASATLALTIPQPFDNHNGGWIAFGPDSYLYIAVGDGGSEGDPSGNAQNTSVLLGKILRLDVSALPYSIPPTNPFATSGAGRPEIWAYGLRNPWRDSFDRATGDLWIADVGQNTWEEIDFQPATPPGVTATNYGWRCYEGNAPYNTTGCPDQSLLTFPIYTYPHTAAGECAITGGYVYRGCAMPYLRGTYFFADYCEAHVWTAVYASGALTQVSDRTAELNTGGITLSAISSFGEDGAGELYICSLDGYIFKIVPRCPANCDGNTSPPPLNVADFTCFLQKFAAGDCYANCDGSTTAPTLNVSDFTCFLQSFARGCP